MTATAETATPVTYGNYRKPRTAGLGDNLGAGGTAVLLVGTVACILIMATVGVIAAVVVAVLGALLLLAVVVPNRHNVTLAQRVYHRIAFAWAVHKGATLYRAGPLGVVPYDTCRLPGLAADTRVSQWTDMHDRPFTLVHMPGLEDYAVPFLSEPEGGALVDPEQFSAWVANYGGWLAMLGDEPGLVAASVTIETAPDAGVRLRREVEDNVDERAHLFAQAVLAEIVDTFPSGSASTKAWTTLTFSGRVDGKKQETATVADDLAVRLPDLYGALSTTGAGLARPATVAELAEQVRVAYDPETAQFFDDLRSRGSHLEWAWHDVGPVSAAAHWRYYRHDSGISITWAMSAAPKGEVQEKVLRQLIEPHRDMVRKRVTLLYRAMDPGRAAAVVESDRNHADVRAQAERASARAALEKRAADQTAQEQAKGAGLVDFGMLVTVTVTDEDKLPRVRSAMRSLAATARISIRELNGSHDSGFAACLPLGLSLHRNLRVSPELMEKM